MLPHFISYRSSMQAYVTNLGTQQCLIYPIRSAFPSHDIPANASFEGYETLGSYPDYLTLTQWVQSNVTVCVCVCVCWYADACSTAATRARAT